MVLIKAIVDLENKMKKTYTTILAPLLVMSSLLFTGVTHAEEVRQSQEAHVTELTAENFHPAFTKSTVIKLNAIVSRSLDVINEYDSIIGSAKSNSSEMTEQDTAVQFERLRELSVLSKLILADMLVAEKELKASDEVYNSAILAGMKDFVSDVEREVSAQSDKFTQLLSKR